MSHTITIPIPTTPQANAELDWSTFRKFADLVYQCAGIKLGPHKHALASARIRKAMRRLGYESFADYYAYLKNDRAGRELEELLNAISTNVTHFFREGRHFELLSKIVAGGKKRGQTRWRIWSAACATGEEPYSIAITLREALDNVDDVRVLATDLSTRALDTARTGIYPARQMEKVSARCRERHFYKTNDAAETTSRISDSIAQLVTFHHMNLVETPYPMHGPFDVVFCRNVMIYFDNAVRKRLLDEIHRLLRPGGHLIVGHAESMAGRLSHFKSMEPSVFIRL